MMILDRMLRFDLPSMRLSIGIVADVDVISFTNIFGNDVRFAFTHTAVEFFWHFFCGGKIDLFEKIKNKT